MKVREDVAGLINLYLMKDEVFFLGWGGGEGEAHFTVK